jgi:putative endonuclease
MNAVNVWVYILRCADDSYYVGKYQGDDLAYRIGEHNTAHYPDAYTAKRRPVELVWSDWFSRFDDAVLLERRLKGWSRAKKEAFMRGDFEALKGLSRRGFKPKSLHPEEGALAPVSKDEGTAAGVLILRDGVSLKSETPPQDEGCGLGKGVRR